MKNKLSCIIPAYNEGERISSVIKIVKNHPLVNEVIVVDDGSKDNTKKVARSIRGIKLISYKKNRGKTFALLKGLSSAKNELIMFIDSDLIGLSKKNITNLIVPVTKGEVDISISLRGNSLAIFKMLGLDFVSGERVFNKKILGDINRFKSLTGFGFESFLNKQIINNKLRIKVVNWTNVSHARKAEKIGFIRGQLAEFSMVLQIIRTIGIHGVISQIMKMRRLMK